MKSAKLPHTQISSFKDFDVQLAYDKNFNESSHSTEREDDNRPHKRVRLTDPSKHVNSGNLQAALLKSLRQLLELQEEDDFNLSEIVV